MSSGNRDAAKEFRKLGEPARRAILRYLRERLAAADDPRRFGKAIGGEFAGLWRYRVGDYRLIVSFEDDRMIVLVLRVGHRREVYD
jgi:mRNA interferase RelE/StbE